MARALNRLSARRVATLTEAGYYADGGGLYLQVSMAGAKSWIYRYTRAGKTRDMGLGPLHTVGLAEARTAATEARRLRVSGIDPLDARRTALAARTSIPTFAEAADDYIAQQAAGWTNPKHAAQWATTLATYAEPVIGTKLIDAVDTADLLEILQPIWKTKTETATRVRQRVEAVLDAEYARRHWDKRNPARWRGHLAKLLPKPSKVRKVRHFPALPYKQLPAFMKKLRAEAGTAARALDYLILTVARTTRVTRMQPGELGAGLHLWIVPAERMKARIEHVVPLSAAARRVLQGQDLTRPYVFPGDRRLKPHLSSGAMDVLLERMGYAHVTVHGFRSTFKDWAAEQTNTPNEVSEAALAHQIKDETEAAYRRGALLKKRTTLMNAWARYCG
jgi:integrase